VTEFRYVNPHPSLDFERTDRNGHVEHWTAEVSSSPSQLARAGWTKWRSMEALKPGTRVKLYLGTGRIGGYSAIVLKAEDEKGTILLGDSAKINAVDLDGVPGGFQPKEGK
jgi:hypothetical protein